MRSAWCMPVQKNAWVTSGTRPRLAGGKSWQQSQTGVFSCRACPFVKRRRSSLLLFYTSVYWCEMSMWGSFFFLFPARSYKAEKQMLAFCLTLPKPLWEVCGCVCVCVLIFFLHQSSSITLSELGSGEGMLSVIDLWPVECSVSQIATYWFAVRYLFKETRRSSWQISEHLAGPSLSICGHPVDVAIAQNSYHRD